MNCPRCESEISAKPNAICEDCGYDMGIHSTFPDEADYEVNPGEFREEA